MIDWDRVATLRHEIGADSFDEVITLFLEEVDAVVARLQRDGAGPGLGQDLHFLRGGALNLGFSELGVLCQLGEQLVAGGAEARVDLDAILQLYVQSRGSFLAGLDASRAA